MPGGKGKPDRRDLPDGNQTPGGDNILGKS